MLKKKNKHKWIFQIFTQLEDTGRYSCLANSPAGDDVKEFLVRVHGNSNRCGLYMYFYDKKIIS